MEVLVTGGAGYVGSILVPELLERGHGVRVLDNLTYGQDSLISCFWNRSFGFIKGDVRDKGAVRQAVDGVDMIIHLAAIVGAPACRTDPKLAHEVNYVGTANVNEARSSSQGLVFASTGSNYGAVEGLCTEETPLNPLSVYAETKAAAESLLVQGGNVVDYRFATAFGLSPRVRLDLMVNDFVFQAVKNGFLLLYERHFRRTFIHVRDMAASLIHAIEHFEAMKDEVYNVGSEGLNYTKEEVARAIQRKVDYQIYFADIGADPDRRDYAVSYAKIRKAGFEPAIGLDEGIDELVGGYAMITVRNPYANVQR